MERGLRVRLDRGGCWRWEERGRREEDGRRGGVTGGQPQVERVRLRREAEKGAGGEWEGGSLPSCLLFLVISSFYLYLYLLLIFFCYIVLFIILFFCYCSYIYGLFSHVS